MSRPYRELRRKAVTYLHYLDAEAMSFWTRGQCPTCGHDMEEEPARGGGMFTCHPPAVNGEQQARDVPPPPTHRFWIDQP